MILRTSTFPKGPAKHLDEGDLVQVINQRGLFKDCYKANLEDGDEYLVPEELEPSPRTAQELLDYIETNCLEIETFNDVDGRPFEVAVHDMWASELWRSDYYVGWLTETINYIMDQDEANPND
jgi:hypothetical protein